MADSRGSNHPLMSLAWLGLIVCVAIVILYGFTSRGGDNNRVAGDRSTISTPQTH